MLILKDGMVDGEQIVSKDWMTEMFSPSINNSQYAYLAWRGNP